MAQNGNAYLIRCPACGTGNRLPAAREGMAGKCGNCSAPLPPLYLHPLSLGDRDFDAFVRGYAGPVLVEFWAPW